MKEDAMRVRFCRSSEALDTHARSLMPLTLGDRVFVQNQHGHHPTKWDKSGTVVELGEHGQYWVKVDGSGRLTLRNRSFLRKFTQLALAISKPLNITAPSLLEPPHQSTQIQKQVVRPQRSRTDNTTASPELREPVFSPQRPRTYHNTASPRLQEPVAHPQRSHTDNTATSPGLQEPVISLRTDHNTAPPRLQEPVVHPQRSRTDNTTTSSRLQEPVISPQRPRTDHNTVSP